MTMTRIEKAIIRAIIMAKIASDAGKGIHEISIPGGNYPDSTGYKSKEFFELRALRMIDSAPRCGINYCVERVPDQNGIDSILVYFDVKVDGERFQLSFHNPLRRGKSLLLAYVGKGRKTRWVGRSGASKESAVKLLEKLE